MSTSSEDAIGLKKALDYDGLQKKYFDLQNSFKEISEKNSSLQHDAEKTRADLEAMKSLKLATELSKKEIEDQLQDLVNNESRLRSINTKTFDQLSEKRDALQKAQDELGNLRQQLIHKTCEVDSIKSDLLKLKDTKHVLERKLTFTTEQKNHIDETLSSIQNDYEKYRKDASTERKQLEEGIITLQRQKETASDSAEQLRIQLQNAEQEINNTTDKLHTITNERDQLKLSLSSTSKSYQELLLLYEDHVTHTQKKISTFEAKIASIAGERDALKIQTTKLERNLEEEKELRKIHLQKLTGAVESSGDTQSSSNLLNLIRDYQKLNRHPQDIYQDFFQLRADYQKVVADSTQATNVAETMTRKLNENENLFSRLQRELTESKMKVGTLSSTLEKEEASRKDLEKSNKHLKNSVNDLTEDKKNLEATLRDTTYQLQYLLSDVQRRNEPIPVALRNSAELLSAAQITPGLPHDQLVYKNVAELQDLNSKLVYEVRTLNEKVQITSSEISNANAKRSTDVESYKTALDEARQTVTDLSKKSTDLQKQLDTMTNECNNYKNLISQLGDGDANDRFEQMKQTQLRQRDEREISFKTYSKETRLEINKLVEELKAARSSAAEAKANCSRLDAELYQARRNQLKLTKSVTESQAEKENISNQKKSLQEYAATRDCEFEITKGTLKDYKSKNEALQKENIYLNSRLESATTAYNTMKETVNSDSADKVHMTHLLEAINGRMELFNVSSSQSAEQYKETIEKLNRELQYARDTLSVAEKQLNSYKSIDQQEIKDKYKESVIEIRLLKTKISEIEQQLSNVNQDRIIAQTKLAAAEEQIHNLSTSVEGSTGASGDTTSCNEHIRLLASAEDRIRILESDIENYHIVIAENEKKIDALAKEHSDFVSNSQESINKLVKELEVKAAAVDIVQAEADKSIAEFKTLHEKVLSSQSELIKEKQDLEAKVETLDTENLNKENDIKLLRETVEEKTTACTEAEAKLAAQVKTTEDYRQTITTLRADVSNLTTEISEYKAKADASTATVESLTAEYKREANQWAEFEESLKKSLTESEKQRESLADRVEQLVQKHAEWQAAVEKNENVDSAAFDGATNEILQQLREANATLRIERDANESKYRYEHENFKRAEAEIIPIKKQVVYLQADCERLRDENKKLSEKGSEESGSYRMQCDAFKAQNKTLIEENERLREKKELALAELEKKNAEMTPLIVKVETLTAQLKLSQEEVDMLNKTQKDWSARSAQLLSKYNRIDPAEIDRVKAELEAAKSELETVKAEKATLEATIEQLETQKKAADTERAGLVMKANERGRLAFEYKKKYVELEKKSTEYIKKCTDAESKLEECEKKLKNAETASVNASTQSNNISKTTKEKEIAEEEKKKAEESLKTRMDEYAALEKKYNNILVRARMLQQEKAKIIEELKTLRAEKAASTALKARITELESELDTLRKTLSGNSVELTRLRAQNSMALNKSSRLQKELDTLKPSKANVPTLSATAPAFQVSSPVIDSPSAAQMNSPVIATSEANGLPKIVTPEVNGSPKVATPEVNGSPKFVTPEVNGSPKVATPEVSGSPKITTPTTPLQVQIEAPTPVTIETHITTMEAEEANVATPNTETDVDIDELGASTPSAADLDADLIEEEATNAEVTEDIAGGCEDATIEEEPLTEITEEAQPSEAQADDELLDSTVELKREEGDEVAPENTEVSEEIEHTQESVEIVAGVKRSFEADEGDVSSPESPSKKVHTTDE